MLELSSGSSGEVGRSHLICRWVLPCEQDTIFRKATGGLDPPHFLVVEGGTYLLGFQPHLPPAE